MSAAWTMSEMNRIKRAWYWLTTMYRVIRRRLGYPVTIAKSADGKSGIEEAE